MPLEWSVLYPHNHDGGTVALVIDGSLTAVVRGASRGIGRGIAERLANDGATVVVNYTKSAGAAEKVVSGIKNRGGTAMVVQADVSIQAGGGVAI